MSKSLYGGLWLPALYAVWHFCQLWTLAYTLCVSHSSIIDMLFDYIKCDLEWFLWIQGIFLLNWI